MTKKSIFLSKILVIGTVVLFLFIASQPVTFSISSKIRKINEINSYSIIKPDGPDLKIMNIYLTFWQRSYFDPVLQTIKCDVKNIGTVNISHVEVDSYAALLFPFSEKIYDGWSRYYPPSNYWPPGETKNEVLLQFDFSNKKRDRYMRYFPCIYFTHLEIKCDGDINPDNNIIEGKFLIWYKKIIEMK